MSPSPRGNPGVEEAEAHHPLAEEGPRPDPHRGPGLGVEVSVKQQKLGLQPL